MKLRFRYRQGGWEIAQPWNDGWWVYCMGWQTPADAWRAFLGCYEPPANKPVAQEGGRLEP